MSKKQDFSDISPIHDAPDDTPIMRVDELPTWMRQSQQRVDWGILIVLAFSLLLAWPLILRPGLPPAADMESMVYMAADYAEVLREGRLYPRWSAAALLGYGAPIPHYHPPAAPYSVALVELLLTNNTITALKLICILGLCLAGAGTYAFVLRWGGAKAGVLAAILYVYSPYVGFTAPYVLGSLPQVLSLAFLPLLLWALHRLLTRSRTYDFLLVVLIFAGFILTAPLAALAGGGLALCLMIWYAGQPHSRRGRWWAALLALGMAVGVSGFFWLPALTEQHMIRWVAAPYAPYAPSPHLIGLISPLRRVDLNAMVITPQWTLGLGGLVFALLGVAVLFKERWRRGLHGLFLLYGSGLLALMLIALPAETWLLGPVAFCFAVVGSAALRFRKRQPTRYRRLALPLALVSALGLAFPVWMPPFWSGMPPNSPTLYEQILQEQQGFGVAVLPPGQAVPIPLTIPYPPPLDRDLIAGYQAGNNVTRILQSQLGVGRQAALLSSRTHADRYQITTAHPQAFTLHRAYFPGWALRVEDGVAGAVLQEANGLMSLSLPPLANANMLIHLGSTPIRRVGWGLSWGLVAALLLWGLWRLRLPQKKLPYELLALLQVQDARLLWVIFAVFGLGIAVFASPQSPYSVHARPGYGLDGTIEMRRLTGAGLETLSYRLHQTHYRPGETIHFAVSWRIIRPLLRNYQVQVYLEEAEQQTRWQSTSLRYLGHYPTRRWQTNRYLLDHYALRLPPTIRQGEYRIVLEVYDCERECQPAARLGFFDADANFLGNSFTLPVTIRVGS